MAQRQKGGEAAFWPPFHFLPLISLSFPGAAPPDRFNRLKSLHYHP
jgi:hypothetical protein